MIQVASEEFPTLFLAMQNKGKHPHDAAIETATAKVLNPYRVAKDLQAKDAPGGFLVKYVAQARLKGAARRHNC